MMKSEIRLTGMQLGVSLARAHRKKPQLWNAMMQQHKMMMVQHKKLRETTNKFSISQYHAASHVDCFSHEKSQQRGKYFHNFSFRVSTAGKNNLKNLAIKLLEFWFWIFSYIIKYIHTSRVFFHVSYIHFKAIWKARTRTGIPDLK